MFLLLEGAFPRNMSPTIGRRKEQERQQDHKESIWGTKVDIVIGLNMLAIDTDSYKWMLRYYKKLLRMERKVGIF
jgi:hypothetical protein